MDNSIIALPSLRGLNQFVRDTLCDRDRLDPVQTPLFRSSVRRSGKTSAVLYHVEGPRSLQSSAMWVIDEQRLMFYDSTGTRFLDVQLADAPHRPEEE